MNDIADPSLSLKASRNGSNLTQISVSDNGPGISDEVLEHIFLPFYSTKSNNSGIGLSLSQQIMMTHHARLEVSSTINKGATFTMIF